MSAAAASTVTFESRFAAELAEMAIPWKAVEVPDPRLLVLNEPLAAELGFDPDFLKSPKASAADRQSVPDGAAPVAQAYSGHQFGWFHRAG